MPGWSVSVWSPRWKTKMGYPCSSSLSFKAHDHGLALQAAFLHLFNLGLLSPSFFSSSNESSRFASLVGSEENDNNEAWRLSTASHTNIHTSNTRNTDDAANAEHSLTHSVLHSRHTCMHTYTHMQCEVNAGSHKLLFLPHQVGKYVSCLYL